MSFSIQNLVSTMECKSSLELYKKMNLKTDTIVINQTNEFNFTEETLNEKKIKTYSFNERGIGLSRNSALMRSTSDICVISDDDMIYSDDYEKKIQEAYKKYPDADMILFNITIRDKNGAYDVVKNEGKVSWYNCLKYGAVSFTFKRRSIIKENIYFSLLFGGGTNHGSGEDTLFIWNIIKKKLKVYVVKENIATVYNDDSSWFDGYNEKYFIDKGFLYKNLAPNLYLLFFIHFLIGHKSIEKNEIGILEGFKYMLKGSKIK